MKENKRSKIQKIRQELFDEIIAVLKKHNLEELCIFDIDEGNSPILDEDYLEADNTYTLDAIKVKNGDLCFEGGSCFSNRTWTEDEISTDALIGIVDFLDEHAEEIEELASTNDED